MSARNRPAVIRDQDVGSAAKKVAMPLVLLVVFACGPLISNLVLLLNATPFGPAPRRLSADIIM
jgi:hypothetical protein